MDSSKAAILWYASTKMAGKLDSRPPHLPPDHRSSDEQIPGKYTHMKVKELIGALEADGWHSLPESAGCMRLKRDGRRGILTIAGKPSDTLAPDTLQSFLKQAGLALKS
ncbi:MAG: type II toxin-antitoxin system HicA family toxin [Candidatus Binataceae bacterium]